MFLLCPLNQATTSEAQCPGIRKPAGPQMLGLATTRRANDFFGWVFCFPLPKDMSSFHMFHVATKNIMYPAKIPQVSN